MKKPRRWSDEGKCKTNERNAMPTVAETLNRAADLIEQRGWVQGPRGMSLATPELCLEAAVRVAFDGKALGNEMYHYLSAIPCPAGDAVKAYLAVDQVYMWNDFPGRTKAEVIEVLRMVALIEQDKEAPAVLAPVVGKLTADDLEALAFTHGGTLETVGADKVRLVGATIDGRKVNLGPVPVAAEGGTR